jgi:hypothetical protein
MISAVLIPVVLCAGYLLANAVVWVAFAFIDRSVPLSTQDFEL